ncbi:PIN domain-containing protein [Kytococcus sp. Marseille-QA3725]
MIVLDTNVVSEALRAEPAPAVVAWLESDPDELALTAITVGELQAGLRRLPPGRRRTQLQTALEAALEPYRASRILPFDADAAEEYGRVVADRLGRGLPISTADAQIAAICRARGASCATRNTRDFVHTGLDLIDPWEQ